MGGSVVISAAESAVFNAYVAFPAQTPAPAVLVLQEIFGVNKFIRDVADMLASAGYVAIAPELYWRQRAGVELNSDVEADMAEAMTLLQGLKEQEALQDCETAMRYARALPECSGKVGAMGYCLGGKLAYLLAASAPVDAAVAYYGTGIHTALDVAGDLHAPLLLHIAGDDFLCPPDAQRQIVERLAEVGPAIGVDYAAYVYPGVSHGFTRRGRSCYDEPAASVADRRTIAFLDTHLKS